MALDTTKVVYGIARVFVDDYDATGAAEMPDPNTATQNSPSATATELGLTQDALEFRANVEYAEIMADQLFDAIARPAESRDFGISGNLIEITPDNLKASLGQGTTSSTAATTEALGEDTIVFTDAVEEAFTQVFVDFDNPGNGSFGRLWIPKGKPMASISSPFGNRTEAVQVAFDFAGLPHTAMDPITIAQLDIYSPKTA